MLTGASSLLSSSRTVKGQALSASAGCAKGGEWLLTFSEQGLLTLHFSTAEPPQDMSYVLLIHPGSVLAVTVSDSLGRVWLLPH